MNKFKNGDIVVLKSGGPRMTVMFYEQHAGVFCKWFDKEGKVNQDSFSEEGLEACESITLPESKVTLAN